MLFQSDYTILTFLLCASVASLTGWFLYKHNPLKLEHPLSRWINILLGILRGLAVFMLLLLLFGPLLKWIDFTKEKPLLLVAIDNSQSIAHSSDSVFIRNQWQKQLNSLQIALQDAFEIKPYLFGSKIRSGINPDFTDSKSNAGALFEEWKASFGYSKPAAIILASDGIFNEGISPVETANEMNCPVYTIALGDTMQYKDILIKQVRYNPMVFAGNKFQVQVDLAAYDSENEQPIFQILCDNKPIHSESIRISSANWFNTFSYAFDSEKEGTHHYVFQLKNTKGERTLINNKKDVFIQVIKQKQKICILYNAAHPDIAALSASLLSNQNFEITISSVNDPNLSIKNYNLIIAHQIPGIHGEGLNILKSDQLNATPVLYILGANSGLKYFSDLTNNAFGIYGDHHTMNEVTAIPNGQFSLFNIPDENLNPISRFPPLYAPFGNYKINGQTDVFLYQKIGNVSTEYPLLFFQSTDNKKLGFLCGEGFWKWRIHDYANSKQQVTAGLLDKSIQFLLERKDNSPFRIHTEKEWNETESILFTGELYNESNEPTNIPTPEFTITNSQNKTYRFSFNKINQTYRLDAGIFPPGNYRYQSNVILGNKSYSVSGKFLVRPSQLEFINTVADHQILHEIASNTNAAVYYPNQLEKLTEKLKTGLQAQTIIHRKESTIPLIELKWLFYLTIGFLTIEWFIRKWNGSV